jgi:hypothetical protein
MIRQRTLLDYARPIRSMRPCSGNAALILAVALVIGLLCANPFADAVGFPTITSEHITRGFVLIRVACGVVTIFASAVGLSLLLNWIGILKASLARTTARPALPIVLTLLVAGPLCMVAALALPLYLDQPGNTVFHLPLLAGLLAVLIFVTGAVLIGIGIWAAIRPSHSDAAGKNTNGASARSRDMFGVLQSHAHITTDQSVGYGQIEIHEVPESKLSSLYDKPQSAA